MVARTKASIEPDSLVKVAVAKEAEEAASLFYRQLSKEIKAIAKTVARSEVDKEWRKKGWLNNAMWLGCSVVFFGIGLLIK